MNRKIENSLKHSMDQMPHPSFQTIADIPVVKMQEHDEITRQGKTVVFYHMRGLALACACFLLLIGTGWFTQFKMIYSIVNVDVNPSLDIMVNRRDNVLSVKANNQEARELLEGRNYKGWNITEMVESLVDDLALQGYLTNENNVILLSVNSKSQRGYSGLQTALPAAVTEGLVDYGITPKLFLQRLNKDEEAQKQAEQFHISQGRQQFINLLLKQDASLNEENLASMNVEMLIELAEELELSFDEIEVLYDGEEVPEETTEKEPEKTLEERKDPEIRESQARKPDTPKVDTPEVKDSEPEPKKAAEIKQSTTAKPSHVPAAEHPGKYENRDRDDDDIDTDDIDDDDIDTDDARDEPHSTSKDLHDSDLDDGDDDSDDRDSDDGDSDDSDSEDDDSDDSDSGEDDDSDDD